MSLKKKIGFEENIYCEACRKTIRNNSKTIDIHWSSVKHKRYAELFAKKDLLEVWNVGWASNGRAFYCKTCNVELNCSFDLIEKHYIHHHDTSRKGIEEVQLQLSAHNYQVNMEGFHGELISTQGITQELMNTEGITQELMNTEGITQELMNTEGNVLHSYTSKVFCVPCQKEIFNVPDIIEAHDNGNRHKRAQELLSNMGSLFKWNIRWAPGNHGCFCLYCDKEIDFSFSKAKNHFLKHHMRPAEGEPRLEVSKVFRRKNFYESDEYDFEAEQEDFKIIEQPLELIECVGSYVALFKHFVIPDEFDTKLYEAASELEAKGYEVQRGSKKAGSRMVMYGMYNRGYCGWFKHEDKSLYAKSERLIGDITHFLNDAFPLQMSQLWKNLTVEGLSKGEGVFAQTPFTGMSITRDYNCAPHLDSGDYGFGFVLWLHSVEDNGIPELSSFWLNEYKIQFKVSHASALYYNANTTVHCTTSHYNAGMLGIALFQKRDCLTGLAKIMSNPTGTVVERFKNATVAYEHDRDDARPEGVYRRI